MKSSGIELGSRIKQIRKQKGLTQDQVAEAAGIDSKSLSRIECNRFNPAIDTLQALAVALDTPIREFFAEDADSPRALRAYLFEVVATASGPELANIVAAVRNVPRKKRRTV